MLINSFISGRIIYIAYQRNWSTSRWIKIRKAFLNTVMISSLLGSTWLSGIFINTNILIFRYVYVIISSAYGIHHMMYQVNIISFIVFNHHNILKILCFRCYPSGEIVKHVEIRNSSIWVWTRGIKLTNCSTSNWEILIRLP